jgi:hypothetical protein
MAITSVFNSGLKIAIESNYSVAPAAGDYYQGGRWIDVTSDGLPDIADRQATIFAAGYAGKRTINNRTPVVGRRWSDGSFNFPLTSDFLGTILYGLMGSGSANSVPSTTFDLISDQAVGGGAVEEAFSLTSQPSDGGAVLRIVVSGTSAPGQIALRGTDSHGNAAHEIISFASGGSLYTRTSFSAISTLGLSVISNNPTSVTVQGFKYFDYNFSLNNASAPTLSVERYGDPTAGAASKTRMHTGMVVQNLTLNTPAAQPDGLVTGSTQLEGNPTATCNAGVLSDTSAVGVWPSWGLTVTRDGDNWYKVTDATIQVNTGARTYRSAAGVQNPQGVFFGGVEVTTALQILLDDESDYLRWQGASRQDIRYRWQSPWKLTSTDYQVLSASLSSAYFDGDPSMTEDEQALAMSMDLRAVSNDTTGVISWNLKSNVPPSAYGL